MLEEQDKTDDAIKQRLNARFADPVIAGKIVNLVTSTRPIGWSRHSNAPYYKEVYANQIKEEVDKMIESGKGLVYRYSVFCTTATGVTKNTLYTRINQSIRYLCEQLDTEDNKYKKWYESVRVTREPGIGILIRPIVGLSSGGDSLGFKPEEVVPKESMPVWRQEMEDWLESDSVKPFIADHLALGPEEIVALKQSVSQLTNIMASITSASVKLIRTQ